MDAALYRSLAFVPGNSERFLAKARTMEADIVCLDLEDSVRPDDKATARRMIRTALASEHAGRVFVRTNAPSTPDIRKDISAVVRAGLDGIVVPKVDSAAQVRAIARSIAALERSRGLGRIEIIPSIESAAAVVSCAAIASASPRVRAVIFGIFDLMHDMGMEGDVGAGAEAARALVPLHARAGGAVAIDSIWQDLRSAAGLRRDCRHGRSLGYVGKSVIHPGQIAAVHAAFAPTRAELAWARRVIDAYEAHGGRGRGALRVDGRMVDEVHYRQACALITASPRVRRRA